MALIPLFLDYLGQPERPSRLLDQHFGHGLTHEDLLAPLTVPRDTRALMHPSRHYIRAWRAPNQGVGSTMSIDRDKFQVNLDVQQFTPEEITVKVTGDNCVTVEGKHEEKEDEHGFVSRHFLRRYIIPKGHDLDKIESKLSSDGVLSIVAPKEKPAGEEDHRHVPITQTGKPSRPIENKQQENGTEDS